MRPVVIDQSYFFDFGFTTLMSGKTALPFSKLLTTIKVHVTTRVKVFLLGTPLPTLLVIIYWLPTFYVSATTINLPLRCSSL